MFPYRNRSSPSSDAARYKTLVLLPWILFLLVGFAPAASSAVVEETLDGPPDAGPLSPHVVFPDLGQLSSPLDCSAWPEDVPDDGYLASIFGHRTHGGGTDFHRGMDLRCDLEGDTCCQHPDGTITCGTKTCTGEDVEVSGAPVYALLGGTIERVGDGDNNNLVVHTVRSSDDISIGEIACNEMFLWYQHMQDPYAQSWQVGQSVLPGQLLGWQGKSGAATVHLHLSTRVCENSRADGDPVGTLDPEVNPFQLIGSDDGQAPEILSLQAAFEGADLLVTVQLETDAPDFDQLEIAVYDARNDERHVRRLGYNSRLGIDVPGDNIDTSLLLPDQLSELTAIAEPAPPVTTSGFTLTARFEALNLASDPSSLVQVKAADVFGNTSVREIELFGSAEIGDLVWSDDDGDGLQDAAEPGLAGVDVELLAAGGTPVASTFTDIDGHYSFSQLVAGDYFLRFSPPAGFGATGQTPGSPDLDSDVVPQTTETAVFTLASGQSDLTIDAGFVPGCSDVALVGFHSEWRTSDTYAAGWNATGFDDSAWSELQGAFGWDDGDVYSEIPNTGLTSYFRLAFEVTDAVLFSSLDLSLFRDDGAIVYLNGVEVMRSNLPADAVTHDTRASSSDQSTVTASLPASHLATGANLLAVEVHNRSLSSDLVFDLELRASVCQACVAERTLPAQAWAYLEANDPDDNNGGAVELKIYGSPERTSLLSWDLADLPADADVLHAELIVEVTDETPSEYQLFALKRAWDEASVTWNQAAGGDPAVLWGAAGAHHASDVDATPLGLASLGDPAPFTGTVVLNVSGRGLVGDWIDGSFANHGLMIRGEGGGTLKIHSDPAAGPPLPRLRLLYASGCGQ